jgi:methyl-accepting chemotaxis protein
MSASLTQIESGAQMGSERAQSALDRGTEMQTLLTEGQTLVGQLVNGVTQSLDSTNATVEKIRSLQTLSRNVNKIVSAIDMVNIQTNMLAVNGSVEAARAGEHGKGFVVVSTDIRNLARDSMENADRIKELVQAMQDQIDIVTQGLRSIAEEAEEQVSKARMVTTGLNTVVTDIGLVVQGAKSILGASEQIMAASGQVKVGVEQISAASTQAQAAATEAASAADQQSAGAEELAAAVEEIAALADELQSME